MEFQSHSREEGGSDRQFGIVFMIVFVVIGLWPLLGDGGVRVWSLAIAGVFLLLALAVPRVLAPLNRLWMKFGLLLGAIIAPIILFLIFLVAVTPTGLLLRLFGKDPLTRKRDTKAETYWITREDDEFPRSMKNQF